MVDRLIDAEEIKKALSWLSRYWGRTVYPQYYHARTVDEAASLLAKYGREAKIISGGVDLVGLMKDQVMAPGYLINIKAVPGLRHIMENASGLNIGALTSINDIERSELIKDKYPLLFEVARSIGSPQVRNMATIAGDLCQEVRCWYYRRPPDTGISFNCRRKIQDGICYAVNGENQYHAIIGGNKCFAVCPSDMATALTALDARLNTFSAAGGRSIPVGEFYTPTGNVLGPDEVITDIQIPDAGLWVRQRFIKFRLRKAIDFAIVSAAVLLGFHDNTVSDARIVLGGVSPEPYRAVASEALLVDKMINEDIAGKAGGMALQGAKPGRKNGYKIRIAEALVKRALLS